MPHVHSDACAHGHGHGHGAPPRRRGFFPGRYPVAEPPIALPARPPFLLRAVQAPRGEDAGGGEVTLLTLVAREAEGGAAAAAAAAASAPSGAPVVGQNLLAAGHVSLPPAAAVKAPGSAASRAAFVEDALIFDDASEHRDLAKTRLHRAALEIMCGADSVALLESLAPGERRIAQTAWTMTGGDILSPRVRSLLHVIDAPVPKPKAKIAEMD